MDRSKRDYFNSIMDDIYHTINLLYYSINIETKNTLLRQLEEQFSQLSQLFNMSIQEKNINNSTIILAQGEPITFTIIKLSKYDGTNGNPAYVAINGIVYDVTNNPAWAAATHFGLKAGGDYTAEFASCHANQDILSRLKPVGRLQDERLL